MVTEGVLDGEHVCSDTLGSHVGLLTGHNDGCKEGRPLGCTVGVLLGNHEGCPEGPDDG